MLFVASNAAENDPQASLNLISEVTELQRRFLTLSYTDCAFLPDLDLEDLPGAVNDRKPDVLHIAAHGNDQHLTFSNSEGEMVQLDVDRLRRVLRNNPPKLVYLNSCDSHAIAEALVAAGAAKMAIGISATISNRRARTAAIAFYESILAGQSVGEAFEQCDGILDVTGAGGVRAKVFPSSPDMLNEETLRPAAKLVAHFKGKPRCSANKQYTLVLGVRGCPAGTKQVTFAADNAVITARKAPIAGQLWATEHEWLADADHPLLALGLREVNDHFLVSGSLCKAIEHHYASERIAVPDEVQAAITQLRRPQR